MRWETLEVDRLESVASLDELERHVQLAWNAARESDPAASGTEWMIRVVLSGPCPLWSELRAEEDRELLGRELGELLGALEVVVSADAVHPVLPIEEHRARVDVLGEALRLAAGIRRGQRRLAGVEPGDLAGIGSDDPSTLARYVQDLLGGADGEIAARLLEGHGA